MFFSRERDCVRQQRVHRRFLLARKPTAQSFLHGLFANVAIRGRAETNFFDEHAPPLGVDRRDAELRTMFCGKIHFANPRFDLRIPFFQLEPSGEHFFREQARSGIARDIGQFPRAQHEPAKNAFPPRYDAPRAGIVAHAVALFKIIGKIFFEPRRFDSRCHRKKNRNFAARLDFFDFGGNEKFRTACGAPATKLARAPVHETTAQRPRVRAARKLRNKSEQQTTPHGFVDIARSGGGNAGEIFSVAFPRENAFRNFYELCGEPIRLPCRRSVNAPAPAKIDVEIFFSRHADQRKAREKIRIAFAEKLFAFVLAAAIGELEHHVAPLRHRGDECDLRQATERTRGEHHSRVARMQRETRHRRAEPRERSRGIECAEIAQQLD